MKNIGLRIFSLIVATMLAYYVHSDTNEGIIGISVPVELKGLPSDKVVLYPLVRQAQVSLKGPSFLLSQIFASPPAFKVKVPAEASNRFVAVLNKNDLTLPPAVKAVRVDPSEIEFTFDKIVKKEIPVQVTQIGSPADGIKISDISAEPSKVTISGPQTELVNILRADTEPLDLREIRADFERDVALRVVAKQGELSTSVVKVKVSVSSIQVERKFEGVPIEMRALSTELGVPEQSTVSVKVIGPKDKVNALRKEDIVPYIKVQKDSSKDAEYIVNCDLPRSILLLSIEPEKIRLVKGKPLAASKK